MAKLAFDMCLASTAGSEIGETGNLLCVNSLIPQLATMVGGFGSVL